MTPLATVAQTRAWWLGLLVGVPGILLGRLDLLVLAAPFIVYVAWAWASRPAPTAKAAVTPRAALLAEGDAVALKVETGAEGFTAVQWDGGKRVDFVPVEATTVSVDGVTTTVAAPDRWGHFVLPAPTVAVTDPTCGWRTQLEADGTTLTVRPDVQRLEGGSGITRPIGISGLHRSRDRGEGTDLADIRQFRPGDRLRRINWRVSSRTRDLHVNSMFVEKDTEVLIVADTLIEYGSGVRGAPTSIDLTARALTAITAHYVGFGDRVAVHDLGGRIPAVRSGSGPRQSQLVLNSLARTRRTSGEDRRFRRIPHIASGTLVFFLSPFLDAAVRDELVRLRRLGGEVVAVDTLPEGLGETGSMKDFRSDTFLGEAWVLRRLQRDDAVDRLQEIGIPVTPWRGPTSLANVLRAMEAARSAPRLVR